ncbi:MAG: hypothetical protein M3094_04555, partial [Actinomycetia bacterium]|nr:hypothetical protein [Actinomycetes bacterium]
ASAASSPADLMAVLRSHGANAWPRYRPINGTLSMPCMHGGGLIASSSSTAGWVSDLSTDTHWITATSAQCLSLFKPVRVDDPIDIGKIPTDLADHESLWWRHERLARTVMRDPARLSQLFTPDRDKVEERWLASPPRGQHAFDEHIRLLDTWSQRVDSQNTGKDVRPWFARRYWSQRDAGLLEV